MSDRKYLRIVFWSSLASAVCLVVAFAHYTEMVRVRGTDIGFAWVLWGLVPGTFCSIVWPFQRRDWLRRAGVVSTVGVLAYSVWVLFRAFTTYSHGFGGDMGFLIGLEGVLAFVVTLGWSILALPIGWLEERSAEREAR
jgi:hypothetical protein